MLLTHVLVAGLATAYLLTSIERFLDLAFLRGLIALVAAVGGVWLFGYTWPLIVPIGMAAAFVGLTSMVVAEFIANRIHAVIDMRRRSY